MWSRRPLQLARPEKAVQAEGAILTVVEAGFHPTQGWAKSWK
jgi:hypothetical protein